MNALAPDHKDMRVDYRGLRRQARDGLRREPALADAKAEALTKAASDVLAERQRQIEREGYDPAHDDEHVNDEIAALACFYAMPPAARDWPAEETGYGATFGSAIVPEDWETSTGDRRRELVKAGALILAEIERLDRTDGVRGTEGGPKS